MGETSPCLMVENKYMAKSEMSPRCHCENNPYPETDRE